MKIVLLAATLIGLASASASHFEDDVGGRSRDTGRGGQSTDTGRGGPTDSARGGQPTDSGRGNLPADSGRGNLPTDAGRSNLPTDSGRANLPTDSGRGNLPTDLGRNNSPIDSGRGNLLTDSGRGGFSNDSGRGNLPSDSGRGGFSNDSGRGNFPTDSGRGNFPNDSGRGGFPNDSGRGNFPNDSGRGNFPNESTGSVVISRQHAVDLTTPVSTVGIDEADAVFEQLAAEIRNSATTFSMQTQAVLGKVNVSERNINSSTNCASLIRDLYPCEAWSYFTYNCACKTAVPIFRVQACDRPALLQITDFLATGDAYLAYANDQLILKTPLRRSLGLLTLSLDPSAAMISRDWSHGEVPIEAKTTFTLKIVPRNVTYETGRGAVRLLPLYHSAISSRFFIVTTPLPYEQAADACAAFDGAQLAILKNERQVKEVALALNKLPGCPSVWFGGVECKHPVSRLFLLFNPVTEQAVVDRAPRSDATFRNVLCARA